MKYRAKGLFGEFGGSFVPEILAGALEELEDKYFELKKNRDFANELNYYLKNYAGRPTPLFKAERLSAYLGGARIYLKREDLCHLGAHKVNNTIAQVLLAAKMGKKKIIAETGAGQHGVASAATAALFGMQCKVFMGKKDVERQSANMFRMKLLGAEVVEVLSGNQTLKDAINEAIRYWVENIDDCYYLIGSVVGPHPYPLMVRDFQSVIGKEARKQFYSYEKRVPDVVTACVGGGSNAIGMFHPFLRDAGNKQVRLVGVEAAGKGIETGEHGAALAKGRKGVLHGSLSYVLADRFGQIEEAYSISAGLDYPGIGPEHAYLRDSGQITYESVSDDEAVKAFDLLSKKEGIMPALESAHAVAYAARIAPSLPKDKSIVICLSGRGDKDIDNIMNYGKV